MTTPITVPTSDQGALRSPSPLAAGGRVRRVVTLALALLLAAAALLTAGAHAAQAASPGWKILAVTGPTNLPPGGTGTIAVLATNVGGATTSGITTVTLDLPDGITTSITPTGTGWACTPTGAGQSSVSCTSAAAVAPSLSPATIMVPVSVGPGAAAASSAQVTVAGGGATHGASYTEPIAVSATPAKAGVQAFWAGAFDENGDPETQAGAHPYSASTMFMLNTITVPGGAVLPAGDAKDINVDLPPGFLGNPLATPRCPQLNATCFPDRRNIVGVASALLNNLDSPMTQSGVYNLTPGQGVAATFLFPVATAKIILTGGIRSDGDFGVRVSSLNTPQAFPVFGSRVTLWGAVGDPSHDAQRCDAVAGCTNSSSVTHPFLTNPIDCPAEVLTPPVVGFSVNSWQNPDSVDATSAPQPPVTGCDQVPFTPSVSVAPSTPSVDGASGLDVDISVPQDGLLDPSQIAQAQLKTAVVQLPEGVSVNPSAATGLEGCSDDQLGLGTNDATSCPDGSKIGTVDIKTPLLDSDVTGDVYLRTPLSTDPASGDMFRLAIVARDPDRGILIKLPGSTVADPATGRLTATFDNNPRLPFSDLKVTLKGGSKGILAMPQRCGTSTSTATLTPWSGGAPVTQSTDVTVGGDCSNGFAPQFAAGMSSQQAGGSGSFALSFSRQDGEQYFKGLTATLPPGLLANVGSVPLCSSAQADADACPPESRIGSADASAGSGDPFVLEKKGDVYLTEGYKGGAYGLLVHVPVEAGPFTGSLALPTITVRQALFVDRHDAHVTVVSDDFPTIDAGIPLRIRSVTVNIDRPGFMINPTSCAPKAIGANITSTQGESAAVSAPFGVVGCDALPFKPVFTAATKGKLKFKQGASLDVHIGMPAGSANIASVETVLPKELPSRLIPTINNACVYDVFQQDYTQCPEDSYVGTVTAVSPVLDQPLKGPVYIVAPPNDVPRLEIVLLGQGSASGIRVDLEGSVIVDIGDGRSKVTFDTVPDVPVTSFDLDLPTGPHSILDAPSDDLCKGPIKLFLRMIAQNGKDQAGYQTVKVADCPKIAKVKVVSAKTTATSVKLRVLAPAEGRLVVSGASLKAVARKVNRRLTYSVTLPLTAKAKKALAKKGQVRTRPSVYFKPVNAKKASTVKTKTLTVKKHAAKKKAKKHTASKSARFFASW